MTEHTPICEACGTYEPFCICEPDRYTVNAITVMGTILLTRQHQTYEQAIALESLWREKYPGLCPIMEIEQA